ncbi:MAG TPA: glycoside hydrolase family 99-like domain-containing protein, partial [Acidimicrobiia bacterium]|nr:glycoside hydrolase family 99-like domain-containing protein [Acidimicrobiia bacterium]
MSEISDSTTARDLRVIAFYLPQFHPVPENDAWWGSGFTEWTNVARARPRYPGHYQPHLPTELGFYDLRVPEVREQQAALARAYGIEAFCYYHYWFNGRGVLDRVFREVLASGRPDFPFCLCWANENWTRHWDAGNGDILIAQDYDEQDDREHIRYLIEAFRDPRYLKVDGRPLLMLYRVQKLPEPRRTLDLWRSECAAAGVPEPLIVKFDTHGNFADPAEYGCDVAAQFLPHGVGERVPMTSVAGCHPGNAVFEYDRVVDTFVDLPQAPWMRIPSVFPGWDNSPRRNDGDALVFVDNSPASFERWLRGAADRARD